jgi:hypothetical protein
LGLSRLKPSDLGVYSELLKKEEEKARNLFIIGRLEASWEKIVGPGLYPYSRPLKMDGNILKMIVPSSAYKMEFTFIKEIVLQNIRSVIDFYSIYSFRVTTGNFQSLNLGKPVIHRSLEGKEKLLSIAETETDPAIREKLKSLIQLF